MTYFFGISFYIEIRFLLLQWSYMRGKYNEAMMQHAMEKTDTRSVWSVFWGAHQRFFKCLCISAKINATIDIAS